MMRTSSVMILAAVATSALPSASIALDANDTMAAWKGASAQEKKTFVTEFLKRDGGGGGAAAVIGCLDAASGVSGHADLPIGDVFAACAKEQGEPT